MNTRIDPDRGDKTEKDRKSLNKNPKNWSLKEWIYILTFFGFAGTATQSGSIIESFQKLFSPVTAKQFKEIQGDIKTIKEAIPKIEKQLNGNFILMVNDYAMMRDSGLDFREMVKHATDKYIHEDDIKKRARIVSEFNVRIIPIQQSLDALEKGQIRIEDILFEFEKRKK